MRNRSDSTSTPSALHLPVLLAPSLRLRPVLIPETCTQIVPHCPLHAMHRRARALLHLCGTPCPQDGIPAYKLCFEMGWELRQQFTSMPLAASPRFQRCARCSVTVQPNEQKNYETMPLLTCVFIATVANAIIISSNQNSIVTQRHCTPKVQTALQGEGGYQSDS